MSAPATEEPLLIWFLFSRGKHPRAPLYCIQATCKNVALWIAVLHLGFKPGDYLGCSLEVNSRTTRNFGPTAMWHLRSRCYRYYASGAVRVYDERGRRYRMEDR